MNWEDEVYEAQEKWITEHCGPEAWLHANVGWFVDDVDKTISTKVYGHGILTTTDGLAHHWQEF